MTVLYCGCSLYRCGINSSVPQSFTAQLSEFRTINKSKQGGGKICQHYLFLTKFYATYLYVINSNYTLVKIFSTFPSVQCGFLSHRGLKKKTGRFTLIVHPCRIFSERTGLIFNRVTHALGCLENILERQALFSETPRAKKLSQASFVHTLQCEMGVKHFYYT